MPTEPLDPTINSFPHFVGRMRRDVFHPQNAPVFSSMPTHSYIYILSSEKYGRKQ